MSDTDQKVDSNMSIHMLLSNAEKVSRRVYRSAGVFLFLGLLVASAGVLYFYFSNDAVFLDKAFYQERINSLEAENRNSIRQNILLVKAFNKRADVDSMHVDELNEVSKAADQILIRYGRFYNNTVFNYSQSRGKDLTKYKSIGDTLYMHKKYLDSYDKVINNYRNGIKQTEKEIGEVKEILGKYEFNNKNPVKPVKAESPYDKPELIFSPKLVYGFFSRLGGLIFIELIAFFLLRQYRINMNEFKYYDGIARQIRVNVYLVGIAQDIEDKKVKIDVIDKLFKGEINVPSSTKEDLDGVVTSSDIEVAKKLLDSVKDLLKK